MKRGLLTVLSMAFAGLLGAALLHVSLRLKVIRTGYELGERTEEARALEEENRKLRVEASLLRNPERIERIAREKLGMSRPDPGRIRVVHPGLKEVALGRP